MGKPEAMTFILFFTAALLMPDTAKTEELPSLWEATQTYSSLLWRHTKQRSIDRWQTTKDASTEAWLQTEAFLGEATTAFGLP